MERGWAVQLGNGATVIRYTDPVAVEGRLSAIVAGSPDERALAHPRTPEVAACIITELLASMAGSTPRASWRWRGTT